MSSSISPTQQAHSIDEMRSLNTDPLLTVEQAALYLNVKNGFIRDLTKQRRISRHMIGRNVRIRESECDRLIREGAVPAVRPLNQSRLS